MYIEPNSDIRQISTLFRGMYNAFVEAGFTEEQAYEMIKEAFVQSMSEASKGLQ